MIVASGILPIAQDSKRICLAWRSPEVSSPCRWGVIGGMGRLGITPADSAKVELIEEMGYCGPIELHPAFVCHLTDFEYHNFVGVVPTAFKFTPDELFKWENSFIEWFPFDQVRCMVQCASRKFHKGLLQLWNESQTLIRNLCS